MHLLRRSLGSHVASSDRDERVESSSSAGPEDSDNHHSESVSPLVLRPLTSHARIENATHGDEPHCGPTTMPPIFPMPTSAAAAPAAAAKQPTTDKPKRKAFLPQLSHAKSFAQTQQDGDENEYDVTEEGDGAIIASAVGTEDTEAFKQAMWAGQANILVTVRVRPHCSHDRDELEIVKVIDHKMIVVLDKTSTASQPSPQRIVTEPVPLPRRHTSHPIRKIRQNAATSGHHPARTSAASSSNNRSREKRYAFDYVFTPEDGQQTVYHHTTKFLIHGVLNGFNATVFAYGCTGAGKTYTMLGTPDEPGIMALTLEDLFQNIERVHADSQATVEYRVTVSFLEVYNENIRDLLVTSPPLGVVGTTAEYLDLREDPIKGPVVAGISEVEACNAQEVMKLLRRGNKHRSQEATAANSVSSRSHAVLQVLVEQRDKNSANEAFGVDPTRGGTMTYTVKYGKLSLVDLAGSERAAVTQNRGQRLIEGANINRSLLALGNCINALGEKGATGAFVPYRDSKLTRLLKDSLGGNCRTVMIANVSPACASVEETLNTLKYANRAKNIKTTVTRNVLNVDHHISEYATVITELKDEIATLKKQLAFQQDHSNGRKASPGKGPQSARHWLRLPVRATGENNNEQEDEQDPSTADEEWKLAKLKEARTYISQCFQQRLQLRRNYLELDHYIAERTTKLLEYQRNSHPEGAKQDGRLVREPYQRDLATSILEDIVDSADSSGNEPKANQVDTTDADPCRSPKVAKLESDIRQLVARKQLVQEQLERNTRIMDEFRAGIEQSPLIRNELLREVLLMEYRVGDLQHDKLALQVKSNIQSTELASLRQQLGITGVLPEIVSRGAGSIIEGATISEFELPPLCDMDTAINGETSTADEEPETNTARSTGFAFLDELRDRFYDRKAPSARGEAKPTGSPRRQWGLHLNNAALPYIRLKKKAPPQLSSTGSGTNSGDNYASKNAESVKASAAVAAPYLTVLKHRRRMHAHHGSSHKRLPIAPLP